MEQCLAMVRGPTDEHRFVGLLMLPKLLERSDSTPAAADHRRAAFEALDCAFVGRLLGTARGENAAQMRAVALAVLSKFADEPHFPKAALDLSVCLVEALTAEAAAEQQPDIAVVADIRGAIGGIARSAGASLALAEAGGVGAAFKVLVALDSSSDSDAADAAVHRVSLTRGIGQALHAVLTVAATAARETPQRPGLATSVLDAVTLVSTALGTSDTLLKFVALQLLAPGLLLLQEASPFPAAAQSPAWAADARRGLCSILSARVGPSERYAALLGVVTLCDTLDEAWLFQEGELDSKGTLPRLAMRLVSVELQLLLEDDRTSYSPPAGTAESDVVVPSDMLSVCLRLAEITVLHVQTLPPPAGGSAAQQQPNSAVGSGDAEEEEEEEEEEATSLAGDCVRSVAQWLARLMAREQTLAPLLGGPTAHKHGAFPEPEPALEELSGAAVGGGRGGDDDARHSALLLSGIRLVGCWAAAAEPQLELARIFAFLLHGLWHQEPSVQSGSFAAAAAASVQQQQQQQQQQQLPPLQASEQSAFDFLYPALLQMSIASHTR